MNEIHKHKEVEVSKELMDFFHEVREAEDPGKVFYKHRKQEKSHYFNFLREVIDVINFQKTLDLKHDYNGELRSIDSDHLKESLSSLLTSFFQKKTPEQKEGVLKMIAKGVVNEIKKTGKNKEVFMAVFKILGEYKYDSVAKDFLIENPEIQRGVTNLFDIGKELHKEIDHKQINTPEKKRNVRVGMLTGGLKATIAEGVIKMALREQGCLIKGEVPHNGLVGRLRNLFRKNL